MAASSGTNRFGARQPGRTTVRGSGRALGWLGAAAAWWLPALPGCAESPHLLKLSTEADFERHVVSSDLPTLVEFYLSGCPACVLLTPDLEQLADKYAGRARFFQVDCSKAPGLMNSHEVQSIPTVILFSGGREVERWAYRRPRSVYQESLDRALAGRAPPGEASSPHRAGAL